MRPRRCAYLPLLLLLCSTVGKGKRAAVTRCVTSKTWPVLREICARLSAGTQAGRFAEWESRPRRPLPPSHRIPARCRQHEQAPLRTRAAAPAQAPRADATGLRRPHTSPPPCRLLCCRDLVLFAAPDGTQSRPCLVRPRSALAWLVNSKRLPLHPSDWAPLSPTLRQLINSPHSRGSTILFTTAGRSSELFPQLRRSAVRALLSQCEFHWSSCARQPCSCTQQVTSFLRQFIEPSRFSYI